MDLNARLAEMHQLTKDNPLYNPVLQLGLDLSRQLESGELTLKDMAQMVEELGCEALQSRAHRLHDLLAPMGEGENLERFRALVTESAADGDFSAFAARWSRPLQHIVFTGHPTFLLSSAESQSVAEAAEAGAVSPAMCVVSARREGVTLAGEHAALLAAMERTQGARDRLVDVILSVAAEQWPMRWRDMLPVPYRFATWVGYDMDGRTDIGWHTSIRHRLIEKAMRLNGYVAMLADIPSATAIAARLTRAAEHSRMLSDGFAGSPDSPEALAAAANALTAAHPDKLLSLKGVIEDLEGLAAVADGDDARRLLVAASAMQADGLGMGWIHFRVNSAQLLNAIRRRIDPENHLDLASGTALNRLRDLFAQVKPLRSNFAALALESTTAIRQFLAMAQIIHHVDADAPIRMLIAECEEPQTVLAALYFARLFNIEKAIDISPLFETESAMEHGGRFIQALLREPAYRSYVRGRGRLAIQTGFSDAGRFIGQLPAALAIERLQGWLCDAMGANALTDVRALIFNTHGESMGRGAHPANMLDRLTYPLSHWARGRFADAGITLEPEISFQGGDGFLPFGTPALALATLTRIAEVEGRPMADGKNDPFYSRTDLSLDFYRSIRGVQREFLESRAYARTITAFGLGLLNETGSRKSRRQSDLAADREMSLRQIRAIPHNAILQQLGYPVNVIAGVGTAAAEDMDAIVQLIIKSPRAQQVLRLVGASNALASIKSLAAFGELFNSAFWASRPYRGTEHWLEAACLSIAEHLVDDDRTVAFRRMASSLRIDGVKMHRLISRLPESTPHTWREERRRSIGALQAIRLALMQHMFIKAIRIPAFSRVNDVSRDDVLAMVFSLRIDDALAQLRRAYPVSMPNIADFAVDEPSDYPDGEAQPYAGIRIEYIDPIEKSYALCLRVSTAIANHFGAHG